MPFVRRSPATARSSASSCGCWATDPRIALREQRPSPEEIATILARLRRVDAAADAPWTASYLQLIAGQPATVARVLAAQAGAELILFKRRVRQLKELGLTESLEVGYRTLAARPSRAGKPQPLKRASRSATPYHHDVVLTGMRSTCTATITAPPIR